jgi:hypothetical protein
VTKSGRHHVGSLFHAGARAGPSLTTLCGCRGCRLVAAQTGGVSVVGQFGF